MPRENRCNDSPYGAVNNHKHATSLIIRRPLRFLGRRKSIKSFISRVRAPKFDAPGQYARQKLNLALGSRGSGASKAPRILMKAHKLAALCAPADLRDIIARRLHATIEYIARRGIIGPLSLIPRRAKSRGYILSRLRICKADRIIDRASYIPPRAISLRSGPASPREMHLRICKARDDARSRRRRVFPFRVYKPKRADRYITRGASDE